MIKLALADHHQVFREGIKALLEESEFCVTMETDSGKQLEQWYRPRRADVIIIDLLLADQSGIITCQRLFRQNRKIKIVVLTSENNYDFMLEMIKSGACAYLTKNESVSKLKRTIRHVHEYGKYFDIDLGEILRNDMLKSYKQVRMSDTFSVEFSPEEIEIACHTANQFTTEETAFKMNIGERTVETYKSRMIEKTNNRTFMGVIIYMISRRIIFTNQLNSEFFIAAESSQN